MKATMGMNYRLLSTNLQTMSHKLFEMRNQAATGKKLNRPSDNPGVIRPVLNYRVQGQSTERYINHLSSATGELRILDAHLGNVENIMVEAKETAIAAVNSAANDNDLKTYAEKINQLFEELFYAGNTQVNGKYLFSGYKEDTAPFREYGFSVDAAATFTPLADGALIDATATGDVDNPTVYTVSFSNDESDYAAGGRLRVVIHHNGTDHVLESEVVEGNVAASVNGLIETINRVNAPDSGHPLEGVFETVPDFDAAGGDIVLTAAVNDENSFSVSDAVIIEQTDTGAEPIGYRAGEMLNGHNVFFSTDPEFYVEHGSLRVIIEGHAIEVPMVAGDVDGSINNLVDTINQATQATADGSGHPLEGVLGQIDHVDGFDGTLSLTAEWVRYDGDDNVKAVEVEPGKSIDTQISGRALFLGEPGGENLFSVLKNLEMAMRAGDIGSINQDLGRLEDAAEQVRQARGRMGNNAWRVDRAQIYMSEALIEFRTMISGYEDVDALDVFSKLVQQEIAFEAALNVMTRVSRLSIMDHM